MNALQNQLPPKFSEELFIYNMVTLFFKFDFSNVSIYEALFIYI